MSNELLKYEVKISYSPESPTVICERVKEKYPNFIEPKDPVWEIRSLYSQFIYVPSVKLRLAFDHGQSGELRPAGSAQLIISDRNEKFSLNPEDFSNSIFLHFGRLSFEDHFSVTICRIPFSHIEEAFLRTEYDADIDENIDSLLRGKLEKEGWDVKKLSSDEIVIKNEYFRSVCLEFSCEYNFSEFS